MEARWPTVGAIDLLTLRKNKYFREVRKEFRNRLEKMSKLKNVSEYYNGGYTFYPCINF